MRNNFFAVGTKTENAVDVVESWHPDVGKKSAANNTALSRYGFAIMATAMAIALRMALSPVIGNERIPFITMFAAVLLVGWYSGLGPALFSLVLGGFAATFFFMPPAGQFGIASWRDVASLAVYLIAGGACAFIGHNINRARERAEENERAARAGEAAIRERDLDLKRMADAMPQVAWIADNEGKISYYNHRAVNFGGIELNGGVYDWHPGLHKDDLESTLHAWQDAVRENRVYEHKHRILMADGGYRWHLSRAVPVTDADGKTRRWYGTATDIHDLKTEEDDREFLLSVAEKIRVGRGAGELLSEISSALGRYLDIHRCLFNEIEVETDTAIVHSDYCRAGKSVAGRHKLSDYSEIAGQSLIAGQTVVNRDTKNDPRTSGYFEKSYGPANELSYVAVPMLRNGKWIATLWCSDDRPRDWTDREIALLENIAERSWAAVERLRAEDVLRRNEEMFSTMVETAPFGVYFIDSEFRLMSVNAGAQKVFSGIEPLIGRDFAEILRIVWPEPFATEVIEKFRHALRTGEAYISPTITEDRANVDVTESYDWQIHRITLPDGSHGVVCYFYDLTHQKRLEAVVRRSAEIDAFRVRLADALRPISDPAEIQSTTGRVLGEYLNVNRVAYFEVQGDDYVVERDYVSDVPHIAGRYPIESFGEKLLSAYRTGNAVYSNDTNADPGLSAEERAAYAAIQIGSYIGVPLIKDGRFVAGLAVHCLKPHSWTDDEIAIVRETAERTWAAVERARAEAALRESEARYRGIINQAIAGVAETDLTGKFVSVNDRFCEITGHSRDELLQLRISDITHPEDLSPNLEKLHRLLSDGEPFDIEKRYVRPDGSHVWVYNNVYAVMGRDGKPRSLAAVVVDLTERKKAEEALRESEDQFRSFVTSSSDIVYKMSADWSRMLGLKGKNFVADTDQPSENWIHKYIPHEERTRVLSAIREAIETRGMFELEHKVIKADGTVGWTLSRAVPRFDEQGEIFEWIGAASDVTERHLAQEALSKSEQRYRQLLALLPVAVYTISAPTGEITYYNEQAAKLWGRAPELGDSDEQFCGSLRLWLPDGSPLPHDRTPMVDALTKGQSFRDLQVVIERPDGSRVTVLVNIDPISDNSGRVVGAINVFHDITSLVQTEQALRESEDRLKAVFEQLPVAVGVMNMEGKWVRSNPLMEMLVPKAIPSTLADHIPRWRTWDENGNEIPPENWPGKRALRGETVLPGLDMQFTTDDGENRWMRVSSAPLRSESGEILGATAIVQDITESRRAEESIRESEARFRNMADHAPVMIWVTEADGTGSYLSHSWYEFTGQTRDTGLNHEYIDAIHPEDREQDSRSVRAAMERREPFSFEHRLRRKTGEYAWVICSAQPRFSDEGEFLGYIGSLIDISERRQAEEKIRLSEERLRLATEAARMFSWEFDWSSQTVKWSDNASRIIGCPAEEIPDSSVDSLFFVLPEDRELVVLTFERALREHSSDCVVEFRGNGDRFWQAYGLIIRDSKGEPWKVVGVTQDITDRKRVEQRLAEQRRLYQSVTDNASTALFIMDEGQRCSFMNPAAEKLTGYTFEETSGRVLHDVIHHTRPDGSSYPLSECPIDRAFPARNQVQGEDVFVHKDGSFYDVAFTASPLLDDYGKTVGTVIEVQDITVRKQAEERLRESEARFRNMADYAPVMIWVTDADGYCNFLSESWYEFTGQTPETGLGYGWIDATHPDDKEYAEKTFLEANAKCVSFKLEYRIRRADGEYRWAIDSARPRFSETGVFLGYIGSVIDITERKQAEETLARQQKTYVELVEQAPFGLYIVDSDFRIATMNRGSQEGAFVNVRPVIGRPFDEAMRILWPEPVAADIIAKFRHTLETGEPYFSVDFVHERGDIQTTESYEWELHRITLPDGRFGVVCYYYDSTELRRAEQAVRESEEKFRSLFESIDEGFVIVEMIFDKKNKPVDYRFIEANPALTQLTGLPDDAMGKTVRELVPDLEKFWFESYGKVALTGESVRFENYSEPMKRWFDVYASRVGDETSRRVAIVFNNITERKLSEVAKGRLAAIVESSEDAIISKNLKGIITSWNRGAKKLFGYSAAEAVGQPITMLIPPERLGEETMILDSIERGKSIDHYETVRRRKDGKDLDISITVSPIRDSSGKVVGASKIARDVTKRKQTEKALRESEERFSKAFRASPLVVTISSLTTGKLLEVNDTFVAVTGYLRSEAVGKTTAELGLWAKTTDREREMEIVRKTGQISGAEYVFRTRDGHEITGLLSAERIEIGGEPCALTVIQDITERKMAAEKIRKSELQLRLVTDSLPALISYVDLKERYQFVNKAYTDWFDQPSDYFIGKTVKQVIGSKGYQSVSPLIKRTLAGETLSIQTEVAYQQAGERFVHIYYVPDFANDGTVRGYFAMISDLTEIKRAEELLKSSEERIALLMENVTDYAIFSTDSEGVVESWNTGAEKIFGYSAEEIIGKPSEMLFTAEDVDKGVHTNEMRAARQKGRADDERWYIRKDGSRFFGSGVMMPLFVGKRLTGYAKIASDLTERKRRAEELQRAHDELEFRVFQRTRELGETNDLLRQEIEHRKASEKQRVQLLHRIVSAQESERKRIARDIHDQFGQRLTALRLKLASLRDLCAENEGVTKRVERLQEIASLLDSEVSFLASELRPTVLDDLGLEEALRAYAGEWSNHFDINLDFHSNGLIGKRYAREAETQFYRIAQEALNNVAKHSGATEVTMLMEQTAEALVLVIEDNGSGFEIGKQSPKHNKGLGLVGMRERAALIGAELELESTSGQGTTIYLRLPNRKRGKSNGRET